MKKKINDKERSYLMVESEKLTLADELIIAYSAISQSEFDEFKEWELFDNF